MQASVRMDRRPTEKSHCRTGFNCQPGRRLPLWRGKLERVVWLCEFPSADAQSHFSYPLLFPALKKAVDEAFFQYLAGN